MRMFVAVVPPEHVIADLEEFLAPRREAAAFRWTLPEHWHLTLAFAEGVPDRAYDGLVTHLSRAAAKRTPLALTVAGGGAFPHAGRARVLFAALRTGPSETTELERLATGARHAATTAGVRIDGRQFRPHLTIGRMNRPVEATKWVRLLTNYHGRTWTAEDVVLIASHLGEGPRRFPRYEVLESFTLGPAGSGPARLSAPGRGR